MSNLRSITNEYSGTPFSIKATEVETKPGYCSHFNVEVFKDGVLLGGYERNYSSYAVDTFYPFQHNGKWYALYSKDYTATRVALLEDGKFEDWAGEESNDFGFCPVEFYVPKAVLYDGYRFQLKCETESSKYYTFKGAIWDNTKEFNLEEDLKDKVVTEDQVNEWGNSEFGRKNARVAYANFGFLCGCIWGDDSSWKLRYIDFSELENKVLKIKERFGYFELIEEMKESIVLRGEDLNGSCISVKGVATFEKQD